MPISVAGKKKIVSNWRKAAAYCAYCPKLCRFSCPVAEATASETFTPWGKQSILFEVERNILPPTQEYCSLFYACLECHRCLISCEHAVDVVRSLRAGRRRAFEGNSIPSAVATMHAGLRQREEIVHNILKSQFPLLKHSGPTKLLLMPGCVTTLKDLRSVAAAVKTIRALCGEEFGIFSRYCCGLPLLHAGDIAGFEIAARCVADATKGVGTIVVMDPGCAVTLSQHYHEHGIALEGKVITFVEFAASFLQHFRNRVDIPRPIAYHDPCHLGRDLGVFAAPRDILMKIAAG